ncbi:hypothetical protein NGA_0556400, partial [Nannochloropsis gaditana CCMP526]
DRDTAGKLPLPRNACTKSLSSSSTSAVASTATALPPAT